MSVPYRPLTYLYSSIGTVSLHEPTLVLDIYKVLFAGKYPETLEFFQDILEVTVDISGLAPENCEYVKTHMYLNGCLFGTQKEDGPHCIMNIDFQKFKHNILVIKFEDMKPDVDFNILFKFKHKVKKDSDTFVLYHNTSNIDTSYKYKHGINISGKNSSYMLLRTNPRLTGNIKLVCTSDDKLYLDTFKTYTDNELSKSQYRKRIVGLDGNYPLDVYNVFHGVNPNVLMNLRSDFVQAQGKTVYTDFKDQFATEYEYGVSENTDRLYTENLKILAPLYIGDNIPDYFIVFRCEISDIPNPTAPDSTVTDIVDDHAGVLDIEYMEQLTGKLPEQYQPYINTGEIFKIMKAVKVFDLRPSTRTGSYLNSYKDICSGYANKNAMFLFPHRTTMIDRQIRACNRVMIQGINYNKGIITETWHNVIKDYEYSQAYFDNAMTSVFEQNKVLHPNILNLEFMFNDPDATKFKAYNYFGLYLTQNQLYSISHVVNVSKDSKQTIYNGIDTDGNEVNLRDTLDPILEHDGADTRIFSISTSADTAIVRNIAEVSSFIKNKVVNVPGSMIGTPGYKAVSHIPMNSFLTIKFDHIIKAGEHFKIIRPVGTSDVTKKCQVIELIASTDERLRRFRHRHGHYVNTNNVGDIEFYQVPFYVSETDTLKAQISHIVSCIKMIDSFIWVSGYTADTLAIASQETSLVFQHIMYPGCTDEYDYLHYYNCEHDSRLADNHVSVSGKSADEYKWYSFNKPVYDITSKRVSSLVNFLTTNLLTGYYVYEIDGEYDTYLNGTTQPLYYTESGKYEPLGLINMAENKVVADGQDLLDTTYATRYSVYTLLSPTDPTKHYIFTRTPINSTYRTCSLYESTSFTVNVLGISPVKDICSMFDASIKTEFTSVSRIQIPPGEQLNPGKFGLRLFRRYKVIEGKLPYCQEGSVIMFITNSLLLISPNVENAVTIQHHSNIHCPYKSGDKPVILEDTCMYGNGIHEYINETNWPDSNVCYNSRITTPYTLVPNTLCGWQGVDSAFDGIRKIVPQDLGLVGNRHLGFLNYSNYTISQTDTKRQFVPYSLYDYVRDYKGDIITLRDLILSGAPNTLNYYYKQYLIPSVTTYSSETNMLVFTANSIMYQFKFTSLIATYDIPLNFSNLGRYEAMVVFDYKPGVNNELFVSEDEKTILFAIHSLYVDKNIERCNNIISVINGKGEQGLRLNGYYWDNSLYMYDYVNTVYLFGNASFHKDNYAPAGISPDTNLDNMYAYTQIGYPIYHKIADFNEPGYMISTYAGEPYLKASGNFDIYKNKYMYLNRDMTFASRTTHVDSNGQTTEETVVEDAAVRGKVIDTKGLFSFFKDASQYNATTHTGYVNVVTDGILAYDIIPKEDNREYEGYCLLKKKEAVSDSEIPMNDDSRLIEQVPGLVNNQPFTLHIIKGADEVISIDVDPDMYDGITVRCVLSKFKYPVAYVEPESRNIFSFESGDSMLSELLDTDYTGANTHLAATLPVLTYVYNKVYETSAGSDDVDNNDYQVIMKTRDVFANPWTKRNKVYLSKGNWKAKQIQMANVGYNIKCFFGSCAMTYPEEIHIENYNFNRGDVIRIMTSLGILVPSGNPGQAVNINAPKTVRISVDFTLLLTQYLLSNITFSGNWLRLGQAVGKESVITAVNNYIEKTVLPLYDIRNAHMAVKFYKGTIRSNMMYPMSQAGPVLCSSADELTSLYGNITEISPNSSVINYQGHIIGTYEFDSMDAIYIDVTFNRL